MSRENVEIVQVAYDAWNRGDMESLRERYDPDVIMRTPEGWPEPGPFVGRETVMREIQQWLDTWDDYETEIIGDIVEAGDRVVLRQVWHGVGHGPESHLESSVVFTMRRGRVFLHEFFWDHAEALEAVGLSDG